MKRRERGTESETEIQRARDGERDSRIKKATGERKIEEDGERERGTD